MFIARYAKLASEHAMKHALEAHEHDDLNGEKIWLKVFDTIIELQQKKLDNKKHKRIYLH